MAFDSSKLSTLAADRPTNSFTLWHYLVPESDSLADVMALDYFGGARSRRHVLRTGDVVLAIKISETGAEVELIVITTGGEKGAAIAAAKIAAKEEIRV